MAIVKITNLPSVTTLASTGALVVQPSGDATAQITLENFAASINPLLTFNASQIAGGIVATQITSITAAQVTGTFNASQIASIAATQITGLLVASQIQSVAASSIVSGEFTTKRITVNQAQIIPSPYSTAIVVMQLGNTTGTSPSLLVDATATNGLVEFRRANNTVAAPAALADTNVLGMIGWRGYGTAYTDRRATIYAAAIENWTASAQGTYLVFQVTERTSTTMVDALTLGTDADGRFATVNNLNAARAYIAEGIYDTTPNQVIDVNGRQLLVNWTAAAGFGVTGTMTADSVAAASIGVTGDVTADSFIASTGVVVTDGGLNSIELSSGGSINVTDNVTSTDISANKVSTETVKTNVGINNAADELVIDTYARQFSFDWEALANFAITGDLYVGVYTGTPLANAGYITIRDRLGNVRRLAVV